MLIISSFPGLGAQAEGLRRQGRQARPAGARVAPGRLRVPGVYRHSGLRVQGLMTSLDPLRPWHHRANCPRFSPYS